MVKMNQIGNETLRLMSFGGGVVVESYKHNQNNEFGVMEEYTLQHGPKEEMTGHPGGSGKASRRKSSLYWTCEEPATGASLEGLVIQGEPN